MRFLIIILIIVWAIIWWTTPIYINEYVAGLASPEIKRAMRKMGPYYSYRLLPDGTLQVNKGDGKWLRLRYRKEECASESQNMGYEGREENSHGNKE